MDAVRAGTPFELVPPYQEINLPLWDVPARITALVLYPFGLISSYFTKNTPPAAEGHYLIGSLPELAAMNYDIMSFIVSYSNKYGKESGICTLKIGNQVYHIVRDPKLAKEILSEPQSFKRGESLRVWRKFSEGGLSEGNETQSYRTQAIHFIGAKNLPHFFNGMCTISEQWIENLTKKNHFELFHEAERVALAAMGETIFLPTCGRNPFGLDYHNDVCSNFFLEQYRKLFEIMTKRIVSGVSSIPYVGDSLYGWIYPADDEKIQQCKEDLKKILGPLFLEAISNAKDGQEASKKLFETFKVDTNAVDIEDLLDKSLGFLQASFETSSKALSWILYLLGTNQPFQERLREAIRAKNPQTIQDYKEIPLLLKTIEEGLRMFPPFPFLLRDIVKPTRFANYALNAGETFIISPLLSNHNDKAWENPESFNPDRFTDEMLTDTWQNNAPEYLTFLGGDHRCPGRFFAKQEIAIFIAKLLIDRRLVLDDPTKTPSMKLNITLHSHDQIMAKLEALY